jgi:hypothetical protein
LPSRKATTSRAVSSSFEEKQTKTWEAAKACSIVRNYPGNVRRQALPLTSHSIYGGFVILAEKV